MKKSILLLIFSFFLSMNITNAITNEEIESKLTQIKNIYDNLEKNSFLNYHPVGSIYITTNSIESTPEKMKSLYGGTWEVYADGRTIIGTTNDVNTTGGSNTVSLSTSNIPSLSVSGTTGSTGSGYYIDTTSTVRTISTWSGIHHHSLKAKYSDFTIAVGAGGGCSGILAKNTSGWGSYSPAEWFTASYFAASTSITVSGQTVLEYYLGSIKGIEKHTHTFTGNYTNSNQTKVNIENPYITVYMYKRTA